jgi:hypothetical protein
MEERGERGKLKVFSPARFEARNCVSKDREDETFVWQMLSPVIQSGGKPHALQNASDHGRFIADRIEVERNNICPAFFAR